MIQRKSTLFIFFTDIMKENQEMKCEETREDFQKLRYYGHEILRRSLMEKETGEN